MHLWQNLGAGQNGKTQEVCISGNSHNDTTGILVLPNEESPLGNDFLALGFPIFRLLWKYQSMENALIQNSLTEDVYRSCASCETAITQVIWYIQLWYLKWHQVVKDWLEPKLILKQNEYKQVIGIGLSISLDNKHMPWHLLDDPILYF